MNITQQDWEEAAAILDTAHDVLLHTGVQCGETYEPGVGHQPSAEANCTWEAIAIAMGEYNRFSNTPNYNDVLVKCYGGDYAYRDEITKEVTPTHRAIGIAMKDFSPVQNDKATVDEVFDRIREGAKYAREQAGALVS